MAKTAVLPVYRRVRPATAVLLLLVGHLLVAAACTPEHDLAMQGAMRVSSVR